MEDDYDITLVDAGEHVYKYLYKADIREEFSIKNPTAKISPYTEIIADELAFNIRNIYDNQTIATPKKVLIFSDSYFYMFIVDDIAESFSATWDCPNSEFVKLPEIMEVYMPDIVIIEIAQRNDGYIIVVDLAKKIKE